MGLALVPACQGHGSIEPRSGTSHGPCPSPGWLGAGLLVQGS